MIPGQTPLGQAIPGNSVVSGLASLLQRIDRLQKDIDSLRPLDTDTQGRILQRFRIDWNYHSNNIEGNSYNYGETKAFLLHGLTAGGKPLRDSLEIKGHNEVILELEGLVRDEVPVTEHLIRELHKKILGGETYEIRAEASDGSSTHRTVVPGRYKTQPNHVRTATGEIFYFTEPVGVAGDIQELLEWYRAEEAKKELHPVTLAAILHYRFVRIHPFDDGNGRMARVLKNLVLMKHGYPVAIIKTEDKENYYRALREADGGNHDAFSSYIAQQEVISQELWLRGARGENLDDIEKEIAIFKAQLIEPKLRDKFVRERAMKNVVLTIFKPFIVRVTEKLKVFDEFFNTQDLTLLIRDPNGIQIVSDFKEIENIPVESVYIQLKEISANFSWKDTRDSLIGLANAGIKFDFFFGGDDYYIRGDLTHTMGYNEAFLKKSLNEALSREEQDSIIKLVSRNFLHYLKGMASINIEL
jgi:Fic family protein